MELCADCPERVLASVVVPVYNKAGSLGRCFSSLLDQVKEFESFEVILVDDGSSDESVLMCQEFSCRHDFVRYVSQENKGVSAARNLGISMARGKYVLFLDADDYLSEGSVSAVVDSFEQLGDRVDVITYPITYINEKTGVTHPHKRETWLTEEAVYDLSEHPFVAQTTMNIGVKRERALAVRFDESLKMGEDQLFIARQVERLGAIGFCPKARYYYVKGSGNASWLGNNPLYAYDDMIALYQRLLLIGERSERMAGYSCQTVLYNIDWRLRKSCLLPSHCIGEDRLRQEGRLRNVLQRIPLSELFLSPYLNDCLKTYLLWRFDLVGGQFSVRYLETCSMVCCDGGFGLRTSKPSVTVFYCIRRNDVIALRGRVSCPAFILEPLTGLRLKGEGVCQSVTFGESSYDYDLMDEKTSRNYIFELNLPISQGEYRFEAWMGDQCLPYVDVDLKPSRHNALFCDGELCFDDCVLEADGGSLSVRSRRLLEKLSLLRRGLPGNGKTLAKRALVALLIGAWRRKRTWLYTDRPTSLAEGPALRQFIHDVAIDDGVWRYYVSDFGAQLERRYPCLRGRVVARESLSHVCLSIKSEVVLTSCADTSAYRPYSEKTLDGVGDYVRGGQRYVYLHHGLLCVDNRRVLSYDRAMFDDVVVSTDFELECFESRYLYPAHRVLPLGSPKLDGLRCEPRKEKRILLEFSPRAYIKPCSTGDGGVPNEAIISSALFCGLVDLLRHLSEAALLTKRGFSLEIKLPPENECWRIGLPLGDGMFFVDEVAQAGDYAIVITDFSAFAYSAACENAAVLHYVPDYVELRSGLDMSLHFAVLLERRLGPFCVSAEEAVEALDGAMRRVDAEGVFSRREADCVLLADGLRSDRLYCLLNGENDGL